MNHPYKKFEHTELWSTIEKTLNALIENKDIEIKTRQEYVIGLLCKELSSMFKKGQK